jgi:hypothetical protein
MKGLHKTHRTFIFMSRRKGWMTFIEAWIDKPSTLCLREDGHSELKKLKRSDFIDVTKYHGTNKAKQSLLFAMLF